MDITISSKQEKIKMDAFIAIFAEFIWTWNVPILVGSGVFFLIYSKLTPFKYLTHAFELIMGKHSKKDDVGDLTHFQALTTALSGTTMAPNRNLI